MPNVYEHLHCVQPSEIDQMGHVNNLCYLKWMMAAATAHSDAQGWSFERHKELGSGWVVRAHQIEYLRPVFDGEEIIVRTWVSSWKRASSKRRYHMLRKSDSARVAEALTEWAFVDFASGTRDAGPPRGG